MESYFVYLLKSSAGIAVLMLFYKTLFKGAGYFSLRRIILYSILIFGFTGPFLSEILTGPLYSGLPDNIVWDLNTVFIYGNLKNSLLHQTGKLPDTALVLTIVYFLVAGIMFIRFIAGLISILKLYANNPKIRTGKIIVVLTEKRNTAFSFFNILFVDKNIFENKSSFEIILRHETAHIKHLHTLDIIFAEILVIFQWFNPFAYWLLNAVKENNEYIADKITVRNMNISDYKILLLDNVVTQYYMPANNFSYSLIKKRLKMMEKSKSKTGNRIALALFTIAFAFVTFSCSENNVTDFKNKLNNVMAKDSVQAISLIQTTVEITANPEPKDSVYVVTEVIPKFPGGMGKLMEYLASNIKYPQEAKENKIEGKVYLSFIVEPDGSISNVKVLKGIGYGCDKEAVRVLKQMPKWSPGKDKGEAVRVKFNIPIRFKLH